MLRIILFELLQLAVSWFAIRRGGAPERMVGWMLIVAAITSLAIGIPANAFRGLSLPHFTIDILLFGGLLVVAARANRFWPYWMAALELLAIGVHGARMVDPSLVPIVYSRMIGQVAYPMCAVLALGTYHYIRRTRLEGIAPRPWSPLRW
ncbi:hypothetical protein EQZ23_10845 [Sphingomonas sp. UV9]|uniref:hypothetical protein n=1 Tax=Sphingomonas sp. UV9 TaxID=1851410 RepID=UPI000FFBA83C|nr:hypothetical protein [Sphingomonas sp. UV9]RXD05548.1 hypothetical protein EQZ23_10845 [Sphingomonas sp. UV9]